ncbi:hypothetical protein FRC11_012208, partial [Ceratobasidium sp. 423]
LQRHGAHYPTEGAGKNIEETLTKLKRAAPGGITEPSLQFVLHLRPNHRKHPALGSKSFVRTTDKPRVLENTQWWKQGFEGKPLNVDMFNLPQPDLAIPISSGQNNTLGIKTCPAREMKPPPGFIAREKWLSVFAPSTTRRLNGYLPGVNLADDDTVNLMSLCGFDTAAKDGIANPWCGALEDDEWKSYEYYSDLERMVVSKVVPFAGSMVVEKIACSAEGEDLTSGDYVRILVNDAVVPLPSCGILGYASGMCTMGDFIQSQTFTHSGGNFSSCFKNDTKYI